MLKSKLLKTGIISQSFLLVVTTSTSNLSNQPMGLQQQHRVSISDTGITKEIISDSSVRLVNSTSSKAFSDEPKIRLNSKAAPFVQNYLKTNNEALQKIKGRSDRYFKIIESVFRKNDLPIELKYLAVVESELKSKAVSHMGAVGPWQLMPKTARWLGLKVTASHDERTHFYKSTVAAAKYLKSLYAEYGDWLLVIAAYNGGVGTVNKAIKKSGSKNFWYLQQHLPAETRGHVKRFIGAHYYFEDAGSETTLTKTEFAAYKKALLEFQKAKAAELDEVTIELPVIDDSYVAEVR